MVYQPKLAAWAIQGAFPAKDGRFLKGNGPIPKEVNRKKNKAETMAAFLSPVRGYGQGSKGTNYLCYF
uniref:Neuronal regeneration-related protein n=1 Tax=Ornithorhynchus anatinus TaxID=9258 RepID=A0A6I8NAQ9_ORNAN